MSKPDPFVTIYWTGDPVTGEMLEDVLVKEGIDARLIGTRNAALLGAGQSIFRLKIEVPESQAQEAAATIEAVLSEVEGEGEGDDDEAEELYLADEEDPEDGPTIDRPEGASRDEYQPPRTLDARGARKKTERKGEPLKALKKRALAGGLPVVMPGLGQIYGGRPFAGLVLMLGLVTTFGAGMASGDFGLFGAAYLIGFAVDIVGGQLAVSAFNAGRRTGVGLQLLYGFAEIGLVGALAMLIIRLVE